MNNTITRILFFLSLPFIFISCESDPVAPPLKANFSYSGTPCEVPCEITFTNLSTGNIDIYAWNFGDGIGTSTDKDPVYTYSTPGQFTVTLVVSGDGQTADTTQLLIINQPKPVASFQIQNNDCIAPCDVSFTNTSTGPIDQYEWDFGDGSPISTEENPEHTFAADGQFMVNLTVSSQGQSDDTIQLVTIKREPPVADFTIQNDNCFAPCSLTFTNTSTGTIDSLRWNFGDGGTSTMDNPVYEYIDFGQFTVELTVYGGPDSSTKTQLATIQEQRTPVDTVSGMLFNGAGPAGTGGVNLITGTSQSVFDSDTHLRDEGIDFNQTPATAWFQSVSGVNGSELRYPAANFDFSQTTTKEEIRRAYDDGQIFTRSNKIQVGDVILLFNASISASHQYFAVSVVDVIVTAADNGDHYLFSIKY